MHHAKLENSPRLQRALAVLLRQKDWITTRSLIRRARICAVNSVIAELRENGCKIETKRSIGREGAARWSYRLIEAPEGWNG